MSEQQLTSYISAKLADKPRIHKLRDTLYKEVGSPTEYDLSDAHITVIPPFRIPASQVGRLEKTIAEQELVGKNVTIHGLGVYPSIRNPRVVLLDCSVDIYEARSTLLERLESSGAVDITQPAPTHVTLFKSENGYTMSESFQRRLQQKITENRETWETTIEYVDIESDTDC